MSTDYLTIKKSLPQCCQVLHDKINIMNIVSISMMMKKILYNKILYSSNFKLKWQQSMTHFSLLQSQIILMNYKSKQKFQSSLVIKEILNSDDEEEIDIQQLLALGNFQVFKAEMFYQNKKKEIAAYQQLVDDEEEQEDNPETEQTQKIPILKIKLEYEQLQEVLELKQAMQISLDTPTIAGVDLQQHLQAIVFDNIEKITQLSAPSQNDNQNPEFFSIKKGFRILDQDPYLAVIYFQKSETSVVKVTKNFEKYLKNDNNYWTYNQNKQHKGEI